MKKIYLVLQQGSIFEGYAFGAAKDALGEIVFTTGMCGYIETLTDPSYSGQIVVQTFPMIGNYGIIEEDFEGECAVRGYVVREWCDKPSNFRSQYDLDTFLKKKGVVGIYGVDTREITRIIRENGVMNAKICKSLPENLNEINDYKIVGSVEKHSCSKRTIYKPEGNHRFKVVLIDYGAKHNIISVLQKHGCSVTVVPQNTSAEEILAFAPAGVMLSNGPGNPEENVYCIEQIKKLLGKLPIFGICLGHQMLALAVGGKTEKLKYGHRGANQPVRDLNGTRTYITSQNHGYAVVPESIPNCGKISFINANDGTCEGVDYPELKAFSVQFHPEACAGPFDTIYLFDKFMNLMGGKN